MKNALWNFRTICFQWFPISVQSIKWWCISSIIHFHHFLPYTSVIEIQWPGDALEKDLNAIKNLIWSKRWIRQKIESLVFVCGSEALLCKVNMIFLIFFLYLWPFTAIIVVHSSYENHHKWPNVKKRDMKKIIGFHLCSILFGVWIINFGQPNSSLIWLLNEGRQLHKKKKKGRIQKSYFRQKAKNALKHFVSLPIYM